MYLIYWRIYVKDNEIKNETINAKWLEEKVESFEISVEDNSCCINILDYEIDDLEYCKNIFGEYPYIISSCEEEMMVDETINWRPGSAIYTTTSRGSSGFRCKLNGYIGFATAGHMGTSGTVIYTSSSATTTLGRITHSINDGSADFAFVRITNYNYYADRIVTGTRAVAMHTENYVVALPVGYTIYMRGSTSGLQQGKVVNYNYNISGGSRWLRADYESAAGDSGGIVFAKVNGDYCVVGVHNGSLGDYKYCTKLTTMQDYYDINIY